MPDHPDLHRDDLQLFAGFLANAVLAAAAFAGQFVFGQIVDDLHTRQVGRQRFALATTLDRSDDSFSFPCIHFNFRSGAFGQLFGFVEHGQLS